RSYLEFVDVLRQHGASPKEDIHALWRRIVFSILISNTDDHLRNHGFVWTGPAGRRLSPAYDLNPAPAETKPRVLTTATALDDGTAGLDASADLGHCEGNSGAKYPGHVFLGTYRRCGGGRTQPKCMVRCNGERRPVENGEPRRDLPADL